MLFMDEVNGFLGGGAEKDNSATIAVRTMMLNFLEGEKKGLEISSPPPRRRRKICCYFQLNLSTNLGSTGKNEGIYVTAACNEVWTMPKNIISRFSTVSFSFPSPVKEGSYRLC